VADGAAVAADLEAAAEDAMEVEGETEKAEGAAEAAEEEEAEEVRELDLPAAGVRRAASGCLAGLTALEGWSAGRACGVEGVDDLE
jgi:hypothetical protein